MWNQWNQDKAHCPQFHVCHQCSLELDNVITHCDTTLVAGNSDFFRHRWRKGRTWFFNGWEGASSSPLRLLLLKGLDFRHLKCIINSYFIINSNSSTRSRSCSCYHYFVLEEDIEIKMLKMMYFFLSPCF